MIKKWHFRKTLLIFFDNFTNFIHCKNYHEFTEGLLNKSTKASADSIGSNHSYNSCLSMPAIKEENSGLDEWNIKSEFTVYQNEASTSRRTDDMVTTLTSHKYEQRSLKTIKKEIVENAPDNDGHNNNGEPLSKRIKLASNNVASTSNFVHRQNDTVSKLHRLPPIRPSYIPSSVNALKSDKYEIIYLKEGEMCPIIFCSADKKLCYAFTSPKESTCTCLGCNESIRKYAAKFGNSKPATISMIRNVKGEINISLKNLSHLCKPQKYSEVISIVKIAKWETSDPSRIVTSADYLIRLQLNGKKHLIIFDKYDRSKCYHYFNSYSNSQSFMCLGCLKKKKTISAVVCLDDNGEEYVQAKTNHLCEPLTYQEYKIVKITDFEVCSNDIGDSQLIVFDPDDRSLCRRYSWTSTKKCYFCSLCTRASKWILAKINVDENGEKFVEAEATPHVCGLAEYVEKIKSPNFELQIPKKGPSKLISFCSNDRSLCYRYSYCKNDKNFCCLSCQRLKKRVTTKIWKDKNGEEYIHLTGQHICNPIKYILI